MLYNNTTLQDKGPSKYSTTETCPDNLVKDTAIFSLTVPLINYSLFY